MFIVAMNAFLSNWSNLKNHGEPCPPVAVTYSNSEYIWDIIKTKLVSWLTFGCSCSGTTSSMLTTYSSIFELLNNKYILLPIYLFLAKLVNGIWLQRAPMQFPISQSSQVHFNFAMGTFHFCKHCLHNNRSCSLFSWVDLPNYFYLIVYNHSPFEMIPVKKDGTMEVKICLRHVNFIIERIARGVMKEYCIDVGKN